MDEIKTNVPKTFKDRVSVTVKYLFVLTAMVAVAAVGYTFLPEAEVSAQVADTKPGVEESEIREVATQAMIDYALNLKSASEYTVYAERGVAERGNVEIKGTKGEAAVGAASVRATKELSNSIDALRQLPCEAIKGTALNSKVMTPGVYCLSSAELTGELVLDGAGSAAGSFIFRVDGALTAKSGSSIRLENGAQGGNVFFVASDVKVESDVAFRANILSSGDITVGAGSTVTDKVLALGKVDLDSSVLMGGTTGTLEVCKRQQLPVAAHNDLSNQIFHFVVTGVPAGSPGSAANPLRVPVNSCSSPIDVAAGPQTVTELNTGTLITPSTGTFTGNFELYNVVNITPASPSSLGLVNLATRVANINVVAGGINDQLTLEFYNRRTITGFVEICKRAATGPGAFNPPGANPLSGGDPDVTGYFNYTVEDVFSVNQQNPNVKTLQVFTIPVGQCTGPIAVTKGDPAPTPPTPRETAVFISELPRNGAYLESVEVVPADRLLGGPVLGQIVGVSATGADVFTPAPGGGYIDALLVESASSANETLAIFANRSNPSRVKVCKIAGPGIPINTLFSFTVEGDYGALNPVHPQMNTYGFVSRTFDVRAGDPAQGGTCEFVPGIGANAPGYNQFQTFINGTPVKVYENGISPNNTIPQNPGELRVSRIRQFGSAFTTTGHAGFSPNPSLTPSAGPLATQSFSTGNLATPITDNGTINVPVNVPGNGVISDVNVNVRLDHTWDEDLDLFIRHPDATSVELSTDNGGSGDNYGSGANDCSGTPTTFDDEAATSITAGTAPFAGAFQPEGSLATLDGKQMNGVWQLQVTDDEALLAGTVGCVSLDITSATTRPGRAAVYARTSIVEVEFTNFRFNPTTLKVCKKAGTDNLLGTNFNFTVALVSPVSGDGAPLFPAFSQNVTVTAGPNNSQEGNCTFVNGAALLGGAFNQGSTVTVTEAAQGNTVVSAIASSSAGPGGLTADLPNRRGTFSGPNGLVAGINSVVFTNLDSGDRGTRFDFDGDGKADPSVFSPADSKWTWASSAAAGMHRGQSFGVATDKLVPADYDGDGITDYAVWRPSNGNWYFLGTTGVYEVHTWGEAGDIPQVGDFDGDGKADFVVFRPSNSTWYMKNSMEGFRIFQFGIPSDKPYSADYDGDGRTDVAVFRNGTWYTLETTRGFRVTNFGQAGDVPVPGDYDGDGAADFAVYRNGTWFMLSATAYTVKQHGGAGDVPVPADYDGDGKYDLSIFRAAEGKWYIQKSGSTESSSADTVTLGAASDTAIQGAQ